MKPSLLKAFKESFEEISLLTGEVYFKRLLKSIRSTLNVDTLWISEYHQSLNSLTTLSFLHKSQFLPNITYLLDNTPCKEVIDSGKMVHYAQDIKELFPGDHKMLEQFNGESYVGISLVNNSEIIGHLAILSDKPIHETEDVAKIFEIVKTRSEAELVRLLREREFIQREVQLRGLINGVRDLIINIDHKGKIIMLNAEAESTLEIKASENIHVSAFLDERGKSRMLSLIEELSATDYSRKYIWIPNDLEIKTTTGTPLKLEGTLSRYELDNKIYFTLVLRPQDNKIQSGHRILEIIDETEYIRGELEEIKDSLRLVGQSQPMKRLLENIYMVAHTDATVLINGETGSGKELVAKHIHQISPRKDKPFVAVNCGAIHPSLIESEFFGHVKGAFTGATGERKGRFQMADGGTIFLDEIAELPLDLQVKLLRVIQENEFEPVGSSKTTKVDVRIIAASHRNLLQLVKENKFREDLYYRLNVFPIIVPPLRERGDDVVLIANNFIEKISQRSQKKIAPLTEEQKQLLTSYAWPGNVRELQNILERSVILSTNGELNFQSSLGPPESKKITERITEERILTREELVEFEKQNIIRALKACNWKVSGRNGAAKLLHMVPSTLSSRITALNIKMPRN